VEPEPVPIEAAPAEETVPVEEPVMSEATPPDVFVPIEPEPIIATPPKKMAPHKEEKSAAEKAGQAKQEILQFEPVTRGRFEKSEPTIVEGEDLDVPTFLRKNIKVK
jgi:cell division protein FtsZ